MHCEPPTFATWRTADLTHDQRIDLLVRWLADQGRPYAATGQRVTLVLPSAEADLWLAAAHRVPTHIRAEFWPPPFDGALLVPTEVRYKPMPHRTPQMRTLLSFAAHQLNQYL